MSLHHVTITVTRDVHIPVFVYPDPQESCAALLGKTSRGDSITLTDEEREEAVESVQAPLEDHPIPACYFERND